MTAAAEMSSASSRVTGLPALLHPSPVPSTSPKYIFSFSRSSNLPLFPTPHLSSFIAGALAGAASRTVVSPLERLKIILQVQGPQANAQYTEGIARNLAKMWREEGFRGYMRGNGINVLRIAPYSAVQFSTYELCKGILASNGAEIDTPRRLLAGSLAGIASVVSTYPLDLVRSRLSIESASLGNLPPSDRRKSTGILRMTLKVFREEGGIRGLYRGLTPTALGVAPYVGINFACYELFKNYVTTNEHQPGTFTKLLCGALAGSISQTLTYPLDVLRRRMQVTGLAAMGFKYNGAWDAVGQIIRAEGVRGLFKGIWPNLVKVGPSIGVSFSVYELAKEMIEGRDA